MSLRQGLTLRSKLPEQLNQYTYPSPGGAQDHRHLAFCDPSP